VRVGARSAQTFELLKEVGLSRRPVMLKRGLAMTIEEGLPGLRIVGADLLDQQTKKLRL